MYRNDIVDSAYLQSSEAPVAHTHRLRMVPGLRVLNVISLIHSLLLYLLIKVRYLLDKSVDQQKVADCVVATALRPLIAKQNVARHSRDFIHL